MTMRRTWAIGGWAGVALAMLAGSPVWAQCPDGSFDALGTQGYHLRDVRLTGPLLRRSALRDDLVDATSLKPGVPVTGDVVEGGKAHLRRQLRETPALFESPVVVSVVTAAVDRCDEGSKQLDVVYGVYTTKVPLVVSRFVESREAQEVDPGANLALAPAPLRFRVTPRLSYDRSNDVMGGAAISMAMGRAFDRLDADIQLSDSAAFLDVAAAASRERSDGWLRFHEWSVGYHHADRPTDQETLKERAFVGYVTTASRPLGAHGGIVRWTSLVEAGEQRTALPVEVLPAGYVASAGYGSWKNALGIDLRGRRHGVSAAYGLQLGMSRGPDAFDYVTHVGEATYEARVRWKSPAWSHRPLDVTTRWSAGHLGGGDVIPATERFFGGATATPFLPGTGWTLRASPELRGFPPRWFNRVTSSGAAIGATSYQSLTVTAAMPFWARPLVPPEVIDEPEVVEAIEAQLNSAEEVLNILHRQTDPAYIGLLQTAPDLDSRLAAFDARVAALESTLPMELKEQAATCRELIDGVRAQLDPDLMPRPFLVALFAKPSDENDPTLPNVRDVCVAQLGKGASDDELAKRGRALVFQIDTMQATANRIDLPRAKTMAARDMVFPRDVVHSIFHELNVWSLGPALMFDSARIDLGAPSDESATRHALGAGLRFTLASTFHLTAGYVWNLNRDPGKPQGAPFFTIDLTAPFGR
jgi:hypothetical protein